MANGRDASLRVSAVAERLRESLAAACGIGLVGGLLVGTLLGVVEGPAIVRADPDRQFAFLTTLLPAIMTVIGVVLSIMVVAQQLASQQFSPRAIRTALRDRPTRAAIGGLFAYVGFMIGAIAVFGPGSDKPVSVPVAMLLSAGALGLVAYLIQHLTDGFRSDRLVDRISRDTLGAVHRIAELDDSDEQKRARDIDLEDVPEHAQLLRARTSGYIQDVAMDPLARDLHEEGSRVRLRADVGEFVAAGTVVGWCWTDGGGSPDGDRIQEIVWAHLRVGSTRTTEREIGSGVQQLVDIALKALSPSINDPETAVEAVNGLTRVLQELAERRQDWLVGMVEDEMVVLVPRPLVWDFVEHAVASIRSFAGGFPPVLRALTRLLLAVAAARPDDVGRADTHLDHLLARAERSDLLPVDLEGVRQQVADARRELHGQIGSAEPVSAPDRDA
ncbi:hypothetical protein BH23ACT9_BH23ACT9_08440 [soil metagenome]